MVATGACYHISRGGACGTQRAIETEQGDAMMTTSSERHEVEQSLDRWELSGTMSPYDFEREAGNLREDCED